jgi:predicted esterase
MIATILLVAAGTLTACSVAAGVTHNRTAAHRKAHHGTGVVHYPITPTTLGRTSNDAPGDFGVGLTIATWKDSQGSTENFYEGTVAPGRAMQVEVFYPALDVKPATVVAGAPPAYRYGPYPVIVFAHGFGVDPNTYRPLLESWAEAGYVVVAPFFPDTSLTAISAEHGVDTESDEFNQPGDIAFVVSQVVAASQGAPPPHEGYLVGLLDPDRLILAGQSDGADTVAALMYDHEYAATLASLAVQPVAVALFSGAEFTRGVDAYSAPISGGPPVLVVQSLTDACNDPADSSLLYNMLAGPKWFLAIDNATHLGPYVGLGAAAATVEQVTVGFFDIESDRGAMTPPVLAREGDQSGVSTISSEKSVPLFSAPPYWAGACAAPAGTPTG